MKVCFITNYLPIYHQIWGGAEQACLALIRGLKNSNIDITIITNETNQEIRDYKVFFLKSTRKGGLFQRAIKKIINPNYHNPLLAQGVSKIIKSIKPDLVHLHNFNTFSISIIKEMKKIHIPIVLSIYDYWPICPNGLLMYRFKELCKRYHGIRCSWCLQDSYFGKFSFMNALERVLFKGDLELVDRFIALSVNSFNILNSYGIPKEKIEIIPLPLYESVNINNNAKEEIILFVGWLFFNKGLHVIIEAMPRILKDFPKAQLWIVETGGIDRYKTYILNLINKFSLASSIKFLGKLNPEELKEVLGKVSVVVIPEQWENPAPLILTEAINFNKPVVASRIGGIPEIIQINEFLAQPKDPLDFSGKISWIFKNKNEVMKLSNSLNYRAAKIFDPLTNLNKIVNIYSELLK